MIEFFMTGEIMGEFLVCVEPPRSALEVLYRHTSRQRVDEMLGVIESSRDHGEMMARRGWPERQFPRALFEVHTGTCDETSPTLAPQPLHEVWAVHPRMSFADRVLYRTASLHDARYALSSCRRAATLGALHRIA